MIQQFILQNVQNSSKRTEIPPSARYKDNILVRLNRVGADGETPREALERAQGPYTAATSLTFTVENCSETISFLDVELGWGAQGTPTLNVKRPVFSEFQGQASPPAQKRLLDAHSPTAHTMLQSYIPACMKSCAHNAMPDTQYAENVARVTAMCASKSYPNSWWRPLMLRQAEKKDQMGVFLLHTDHVVRWTLRQRQSRQAKPNATNIFRSGGHQRACTWHPS